MLLHAKKDFPQDTDQSRVDWLISAVGEKKLDIHTLPPRHSGYASCTCTEEGHENPTDWAFQVELALALSSPPTQLILVQFLLQFGLNWAAREASHSWGDGKLSLAYPWAEFCNPFKVWRNCTGLPDSSQEAGASAPNRPLFLDLIEILKYIFDFLRVSPPRKLNMNIFGSGRSKCMHPRIQSVFHI